MTLKKITKKISNFVLTSFILSMVVHLYVTDTFAATLRFDPIIENVKTESEIVLDVNIDTENESINAFEGKIDFPGDLLELKDIRDGNSIISFWVERPHVSKKLSEIFPQEISFSGITPGGYSGKQGYLFSLVFRTKTNGNVEITPRDFRLLVNDGSGTPTTTNASAYKFTISKDGKFVEPSETKDTQPPEPFEVFIASDKNIFNGKYFASFATQDKGSGIDYYEIYETSKEGMSSAKWVRGESPYELKDQSLSSFIYVKALDKAGNRRIAVVRPQKSRVFEEKYFQWFYVLGGIIGIILILLVGNLLWKKYRGKFGL